KICTFTKQKKSRHATDLRKQLVLQNLLRNGIKSSKVRDSDEEVFEDQEVNEPSSDDATESTSSRKKSRVSGNSSKKKATKLVPVDERFKKMPLDVIFEIFAHLRPLDILRLSRTKHLWYFVCGNHCYTVFWDCRVRCCKKCVYKVLSTQHEIYRKNLQAYKFLGYLPFDCIRLKSGRMERLFLDSAFQLISDDYQQNVTVLNDKGERLDDVQKLAAWKLPMDTKRTEHRHYTRLCEQWSEGQRNSREDELREIRQQRRNQIENRLIELGWGPELERLQQENRSDDFWNHKLIKQSKLLTDRMWDQITPTVFELLQPVRDRRLRVEQVNALKPRYEALKRCYDIYIFQQENLKKSGFPPFGDVIESHIGYDIIFDTPYEQTLSEDAFHEELKKLPDFIDDWNKRKTQELVEIVRKAIPEATVDTLGLAKTVFMCETCKDFLWYPEVFQHCCYPGRRAHWQTREYVPSNPDIYHGFNPYDKCGSVPWNKLSTRIIFSETHSICLSLVMQTCGLDPDTAVHEDLDSLDDVILECKSCDHNGRRNFMRWSRAFLHIHLFGQSHVPTPVKPSEQLRQKLLEFEKPKEWNRIRVVYTCDHCPDTPTGKQNHNYSDLCSHLRQEHGKEQVTRKDWSCGPSVTFSEKAPDQFVLEWPVDDANDTPQV
ncbi:hypothetical protein K435DRAFT_782942, partial [Dendrothele bispora CBS 962.96]